MYRTIEPEELKIDKTLGYVYFIDKNHPLSSKNIGRVYYHRHVASIKTNRWLVTDEVVHHIDGNKQNNQEKNLMVLSNSDHQILHAIEKGSCVGLVELECPVCKTTFYAKPKDNRVTCSTTCSAKKSIQWDISKDDLEILIWNLSFTEISKRYPISDVGAKKKAKSLGCLLPTPYFFNKSEAYRQQQRQVNNIPDLPL
jgi:hypothetical protein